MRTSNPLTTNLIRAIQALVVTTGLFGIMVVTVPYWLKPIAALAEVPCTVPYTFINGTVAQASQVNANFTALTSCLSTIYASDIVPATAAQATFGGTLQYTFPAGVAVAGNSTGPYTNTTGPLWIIQGGNSNGTYGINFDMNGCGGTGSYQFKVAGTQQDSIDCNGNITNGKGSIFANAITANNGVFQGNASPTQLCNITSGAGCINVNPAGNLTLPTGTLTVTPTSAPAITSNGPIVADPQPTATAAAAASPGPVGGCYLPAGTICPSTWHTVYVTTLQVTVALSNCTSGSACTFTMTPSGGVNCVATTQCNFNTPDGAWDVDCAVFSPVGHIMTGGWVTGSPPTLQILTWLNESGGTVNIGSGFHVGMACSGQ